MLAINPQLVGTPSTSKAYSDFDEDEERDDDENDDDEDESQAQVESKRVGAAIAPVKVGGHGKLRKGTVQGGGVMKKTGSGTKDKENSEKREVPEDGKPADYQKLSSKEKRQLRNKISARNFRVRRKGEYAFFSTFRCSFSPSHTSIPALTPPHRIHYNARRRHCRA
jgi:hypothetical protein